MKALILGAGRGTRVRPVTDLLPKPMMPILNRPVMELIVDNLRRHGVDQIIVNTSYRATDIEDYFRDGSRFGVEMTYSYEGTLEDGLLVDRPVGSAGALRRIQEHAKFFDDTFLVLCGDALADIDVGELLRFHRQKNALATIATTTVPLERISSYGVVVTDDDGKVVDFQEKPAAADAAGNSINTGIYVFEPEIVDEIPAGTACDIGGELFPNLVREGQRVYAVDLRFQWLDIGTLSDYYRVLQMALTGGIRDFQLPGTEVAPGIWAGLNVRLDPATCSLEPPIYIGGSASLEPGCTVIGPTMIGAGCVIEAGALVERSILFDYSRIGASASVAHMLVCGGHCVAQDGSSLDLAKADIGWVIRDARSPLPQLSPEQKQLLDMLTMLEAPQLSHTAA